MARGYQIGQYDPCNLTHSLKNEMSHIQIIEIEFNYKNWPLGVCI